MYHWLRKSHTVKITTREIDKKESHQRLTDELYFILFLVIYNKTMFGLVWFQRFGAKPGSRDVSPLPREGEQAPRKADLELMTIVLVSLHCHLQRA